MVDLSSLEFHAIVAGCLTLVAVSALVVGDHTICGTALGALGMYVLKNGLKSPS